MFALLLDYVQTKNLAALTHPALRWTGTCGAPLDPAIKAAAERLFGMPLHNGYGITECAPTIAQTRIEDPRTDCSAGRVLPGVAAKIVRLDGAPAEPGETGELWVPGPNVMQGYYKAPAETAAVLDAEGWFNTGDLVRFDGAYLFILGRTKG
jgi:long-subunit acyl-CoA synthetase (AMP-forming)